MSFNSSQQEITGASPRIVMLGSEAVGKTSLISQIISKTFTGDNLPTTAASFFEYTTPEPDSRTIVVWDTAGMERFRSLNTIYYRNAIGAILVFDLTNYESFKELKNWITTFTTYSLPNPVITLVGNKNDLTDKFEVPEDDISKFARDNDIPFFLTSAKTGYNVADMFQATVKRIPNFESENQLQMANKSCC